MRRAGRVRMIGTVPYLPRHEPTTRPNPKESRMRHASFLALTLIVALASAVAVRPAPRAAFDQDDAGQAAGSISRDEEYRRINETFPIEPPQHQGGQVILG